MHAKIKYKGIVAYTVLNVCEEIHQFLPSNKKNADKRKLVPFFCFMVYFRKSANMVFCLR